MTLTLLILSGLVALLPAWSLLFYGLIRGTRASGRGASLQAGNQTAQMPTCSADKSMRPMPSLVLSVNQGFYPNPVCSYLILSANGWGLHQTQWFRRVPIAYRLRLNAPGLSTAKYLENIRLRYRHRCNACRLRMATLSHGPIAICGSAEWKGTMHGGIEISRI